MRVCFIEDTHLHGGTQIWVTEALRAFLARGAEVTLLAPTNSWVVQQCADTEAHIFSYDWDEVVNEGMQEREIWTAALGESDVAVCTVHPPRNGFHCAVFAARCIRAAGLRTHLIPKTGTIVPEYKREFYRPDEEINASVIAIADFTRRYLIETYQIPAEVIALIYQGVDVSRFTSSTKTQAEARKRYPLPEVAAPVLASIGSFEHRKGHPVLFDALAQLASGLLSEVHLMLVGDGPDEEMLKEQAGVKGLEKHVTFFPFTSEPNYVFERADITVLPSLYKEGLPNVILESLSMETPVVSSNLGGVPEAVIEGETGLMVAPGESAQLAEAIHELWSRQEHFQRMKTKARDLVAEKFDKERQFDAFLNYFRGLR